MFQRIFSTLFFTLCLCAISSPFPSDYHDKISRENSLLKVHFAPALTKGNYALFENYFYGGEGEERVGSDVITELSATWALSSQSSPSIYAAVIFAESVVAGDVFMSNWVLGSSVVLEQHQYFVALLNLPTAFMGDIGDEVRYGETICHWILKSFFNRGNVKGMNDFLDLTSSHAALGNVGVLDLFLEWIQESPFPYDGKIIKSFLSPGSHLLSAVVLSEWGHKILTIAVETCNWYLLEDVSEALSLRLVSWRKLFSPEILEKLLDNRCGHFLTKSRIICRSNQIPLKKIVWSLTSYSVQEDFGKRSGSIEQMIEAILAFQNGGRILSESITTNHELYFHCRDPEKYSLIQFFVQQKLIDRMDLFWVMSFQAPVCTNNLMLAYNILHGTSISAYLLNHPEPWKNVKAAFTNAQLEFMDAIEDSISGILEDVYFDSDTLFVFSNFHPRVSSATGLLHLLKLSCRNKSPRINCLFPLSINSLNLRVSVLNFLILARKESLLLEYMQFLESVEKDVLGEFLETLVEVDFIVDIPANHLNSRFSCWFLDQIFNGGHFNLLYHVDDFKEEYFLTVLNCQNSNLLDHLVSFFGPVISIEMLLSEECLDAIITHNVVFAVEAVIDLVTKSNDRDLLNVAERHLCENFPANSHWVEGNDAHLILVAYFPHLKDIVEPLLRVDPTPPVFSLVNFYLRMQEMTDLDIIDGERFRTQAPSFSLMMKLLRLLRFFLSYHKEIFPTQAPSSSSLLYSKLPMELKLQVAEFLSPFDLPSNQIVAVFKSARDFIHLQNNCDVHDWGSIGILLDPDYRLELKIPTGNEQLACQCSFLFSFLFRQ